MRAVKVKRRDLGVEHADRRLEAASVEAERERYPCEVQADFALDAGACDQNAAMGHAGRGLCVRAEPHEAAGVDDAFVVPVGGVGGVSVLVAEGAVGGLTFDRGAQHLFLGRGKVAEPLPGEFN